MASDELAVQLKESETLAEIRIKKKKKKKKRERQPKVERQDREREWENRWTIMRLIITVVRLFFRHHCLQANVQININRHVGDDTSKKKKKKKKKNIDILSTIKRIEINRI